MSNRDEFLHRPTARIHRWNESPIHAGKDLQAGGTWMGVASDGRWAALTNFRDGFNELKDAPSRGALVVDFLHSSQSPNSYSKALDASTKTYNGYNLLLGGADTLYYQSNRNEGAHKLPAGVYGLSNHLLDTSWPKVEQGKRALERTIGNGTLNKEALFELLQNKDLASDEHLPDTGIPYKWEKMLSAMYIESPDYGTRVSTILLQDYEGNTYVEERAYQPKGEPVYFELSGKEKDLKKT